MSLPTTEVASDLPADAVVASSLPADQARMCQQHERYEQIGAMLQQIILFNGQVEAISRKYFPGGVTLTLEADPEVPEAYFMVHARVRGTVEEVAVLHQKWTAELWDQLRKASRFYGLSVIFQ